MTSILPNCFPSTCSVRRREDGIIENSIVQETRNKGGYNVLKSDAVELLGFAAKAFAEEVERLQRFPPAKRQRTSSDSCANQPAKFRSYQEEKWQERLNELKDFRRATGHCLVPHTYPENPELARWVKRQRSQYGLFKQGKKSSISEDRIQILNDLGFVWNSYEQTWRERLHELLDYKEKHGNCAVPTSYPCNQKLAIWVKGQRRQYKLYCDGKPSNITAERIAKLNKHSFQWNVR